MGSVEHQVTVKLSNSELRADFRLFKYCAGRKIKKYGVRGKAYSSTWRGICRSNDYFV